MAVPEAIGPWLGLEWGAIATWLGFLLLVGLAGWPIAAWPFARWTDRGATLAIPVGLVVVWVVAYWTGQLSWGVAPFLGVGALAVGSVVATRTAGPELDWRAALEAGGVFVVAFLFVVAFRAVDPAVHPIGGEKFLDFGLLKSILRADQLPPEDMWFAGEPVQYYYGGHLLVAALAEVTGVPARFAYNLGLATTYATLVTGVYGLAGEIAHTGGRSRRVAAVAGAFAVGFASNLETPARVALSLLPEGLATGLASTIGDAAAATWTPNDFSYWSASRVIEGAINEFPLFAWLNGDLHAHMSSTGFLVLLLALLFALWQTPPADRGRRRVLAFGAVPLVGGLIAVTNTWSFPTVAGLTWLTLTFAPGHPARLLGITRLVENDTNEPARDGGHHADGPGVDWRGEAWRTLAAALGGGVTIVGSALVALPFWLGTASTRSVAFLPERTSTGELLLVLGGFLALFLPFLALRLSGERYRVGTPTVLVAVVVAGLFAGFGAPAVALVGPVLVAGWIAVRTRNIGFTAVPLVGAAGLVLVVEFAFVQEHAGPERFNTVFKTYMQVWVLWAVAAGVTGADLLSRARRSAAGPAARPADPATAVRRAGAVAQRWAPHLLVGVLAVSTSLYGGFALVNHFDGPQDPTLDATRFVSEAHPEEAAAIDWLDRREGRPVIVTAAPGGYRWNPSDGKGASAPASLTGVPTVAGWFHERGYRGPEPFAERVGHVETIYEGPRAEQRALLDRYEVRYIYVGPAERARYDLDLPDLPIAHRSGDVTIYRVPDDGAAAGS